MKLQLAMTLLQRLLAVISKPAQLKRYIDALEDDHGYTKRARVSCSRATASAMQLLLGDDYTENSSSLLLQSELENYFGEPSIPSNRDPLS